MICSATMASIDGLTGGLPSLRVFKSDINDLWHWAVKSKSGRDE